MLTPDITLNSTQEEQAALYYFGTLYYLMWQFPCEGREILRHNGFRCQAWVESLFKVAADHGCFGRKEPTKVTLPFKAVRTAITPEIVALTCLADDILRAAYYERYLIELRIQILDGFHATRKTERRLERIRQARQKFHIQKKEYLRIAYGKSLKGVRESYDINVINPRDELQKNLLDTFDFVPIVSQLYPREPFSADLSPISRIYRKYEDVFPLCKESDSLPPV